MSVAEILLQAGVVQRGEFVLASGKKTNVYYDLRKLFKRMDLLDAIAERVAGELRDSPLALRDAPYAPLRDAPVALCGAPWASSDAPVALCGAPYAGIPLANLVAQKLGLPLILARKEKKAHGSGQQIEANGLTRCWLVDDVYTTGKSLRELAQTLHEAGVEVLGAIVVLDRSDSEASCSFPVKSLITMRQLLAVECITRAKPDLRELIALKGRLCYSADCETFARALEIIELVSPHVCMVKLHADMYEIEPEQIAKLIELQRAHGFAILEDRKFADIGAITKRQAERVTYANYVTCHAIAGAEAVRAIPDHLGVFLVAQMSTADNLFCARYTAQCVAIARAEPCVVGLIAQERPPNSRGLLIAQPGINLEETRDAHGQTYRAELLGDIAIVGRGITRAEDPVAAAKKYASLFPKLDASM